MSRNSISNYGETIYMIFTEQRNILHKINNYFCFRYYHRLDYVSVDSPLIDGSSVAAAVGYYIAVAWKWAEQSIFGRNVMSHSHWYES